VADLYVLQKAPDPNDPGRPYPNCPKCLLEMKWVGTHTQSNLPVFDCYKDNYMQVGRYPKTIQIHRETVELELTNLWKACRDGHPEGSHAAKIVIDSFRVVGLLDKEQAELWVLRLGTCPGHNDEGGRDWCAYGCKLDPDPHFSP
jgi:hypothetical protein